MTSPKISDQKYSLSASPDRESAISRNAVRMMDELNRKIEDSGYKAYLGKSGTSGPSTAPVDEYFDDDSFTSEEEASMSNEMSKEYSESDSSTDVSERKRIPNELLRRQKKANMRYNALTPHIQKLFRDPENTMVEATLKKEGIDVNFLQNLADVCRKSKSTPMKTVHRKIQLKGYPREWASDMIRICVVTEDTLLVDISNQVMDIEDCVGKLQRSLEKIFEYRSSQE
ncbi:uncharacterized protein TRUGW13939_07646 [Talaromyces rugulosus]|uniref:Uncharacterized protein n=1 Tax=Talaromyces rugulosus TaxID=121627 RepID=A0A7H8R490_TALRU|nr:uncharacterized protein TRUGW13939_07646 [Talaromyces rugulosus]QKX60501.1 hypothetical protein TRUGW13939_07646 [Talaromyces rugulosus]